MGTQVVLLFNSHVLNCLFYVCLILTLKRDLVTLIRKEKDFYDSCH